MATKAAFIKGVRGEVLHWMERLDNVGKANGPDTYKRRVAGLSKHSEKGSKFFFTSDYTYRASGIGGLKFKVDLVFKLPLSLRETHSATEILHETYFWSFRE